MVINSVQKALKILKAVSDGEGKPVTHSDICEKTGINKSTCSHIISTIIAEGYLKKSSSGRGYLLGPEAYSLSRHGRYDGEFVRLCHPVMRWLYNKTGCAVILSVVHGGKKFIIDYIDENSLIFAEHYKIRRDDLYRTATGRIILANMTAQELKKTYALAGAPEFSDWSGVDSYEKLSDELSRIDKKGVIYTCNAINERRLHFGYAAALFKNAQCVGALGLASSCGLDEINPFPQRKDELGGLLLKARNEIGRRLSFL